MRRRPLLVSMALPNLAGWHIPGRTEVRRLRIGLTPVILADQAAFLARWADYLAPRVGCPVVFVARDEYQPILDLLFGGQLDAAWICG